MEALTSVFCISTFILWQMQLICRKFWKYIFDLHFAQLFQTFSLQYFFEQLSTPWADNSRKWAFWKWKVKFYFNVFEIATTTTLLAG